MVLTITQEAFDAAVQENMELLEMPEAEALEEAIKQFEAEGADLSTISTVGANSSVPSEIVEICNKLKSLVEGDNETQVYVENLKLLKKELDKGLNYKVAAAKEGAYDVILKVANKFQDDETVLVNCLKTLTALMTKQPDLLNEAGRKLILSNLEKQHQSEVIVSTLKWTKECCIMQEMNRQKLFEDHILNKLKHLFADGSNDVVKGVLTVFRALILDDDIRVEFGHAHDHAKNIASETLNTFIELLNKFKGDEQLVHDLKLTLAALLVRSEFCKQVEEAGGLEILHNVMVDYIDNEKITKQCFKLIKALSGNDEVKSQIIQKGLASVINGSLDRHKRTAQTASAGLSAIAALTLRNPENSKALFEAGIADTIIDVMKLHLDDKSVQKNASWAVRNMVSRSRYQNSHFLELGVEEILQNNLKKFSESAYDFKAALRDLECDVDLNEEWTGKGGILTNRRLEED